MTEFWCLLKHKGQTVRQFKIRYKEHLLSFKSNSNKSVFVQHLITKGHVTGPMEEIMVVVHMTYKK